MFESYKDIFNKRGLAYHKAMLTYPLARTEEFIRIIELAGIEDGHTVVDIPSGGCYLNSFIDKSVTTISIETSHEFVRDSMSSNKNIILVCDDIASTSLKDQSVDRVASLAGLHHVMDKYSFFQEIHRILKTEGIFCIADAYHNSNVAKFLNIFVDQNNSMGHKGIFLDNNTRRELEAANFQICYDAPQQYCWEFNSTREMAEYCKLLFGIDRANQAEVVDGIKDYLGYLENSEKCLMNWELHFIKCIKRTT